MRLACTNAHTHTPKQAHRHKHTLLLAAQIFQYFSSEKTGITINPLQKLEARCVCVCMCVLLEVLCAEDCELREN